MNCPITSCEDNYVGETARRRYERIKGCNGRDHKSHILKHSVEKRHNNEAQENFTIIAKIFQNSK